MQASSLNQQKHQGSTALSWFAWLPVISIYDCTNILRSRERRHGDSTQEYHFLLHVLPHLLHEESPLFWQAILTFCPKVCSGIVIVAVVVVVIILGKWVIVIVVVVVGSSSSSCWATRGPGGLHTQPCLRPYFDRVTRASLTHKYEILQRAFLVA